MNPKIRALIWEELRTGGVIAGWCVVVAALCVLSTRFTMGGRELQWDYCAPVVLTFSALSIVLLAFLLLFRVGNSGALTGGYSGRVLLLPVETWKLAALSLSLRTLLLCVATLLILLICRALFSGHGPAWVIALLVPGIFLPLQTLDWLRRPNPWLAWMGLLLLIGVCGIVLARTSLVRDGIDTAFMPGSTGLLLLLAAAAISFPVALVALLRTRRGAQRRISIRFALPEAVTLPGHRKGFRSPRGALLWSYLCRDGYLLPVFALGIGTVAALSYGIFLGLFAWIWIQFASVSDLEVLSGLSRWFVAFDWGVWPVFVLSVLLWASLRGGAGVQRGVRPVLTEYLYPVSAADMTVTRLWGYGIVVGGTWLGALVLSNVGFFVGDDGLAWHIWWASLAAGESSVRELLASRLLLPVIILIGAWALTAIRTRLVAWLLGLIVIYTTTAALSYELYFDGDFELLLLIPLSLTVALMAWTRNGYGKSWPIAALWLLPLGLAGYFGVASLRSQSGENSRWIAMALIVVVCIASIIWSWRRGILPLRHAVGCGVAWLLTVLFTYPFGYWELSGIDRQSLIYAAMLGALVVLPYPALLLDLHRRRHHDDTPVSAADHDLRTGWGLSAGLRSTSFVLMAVLMLGMLWLRWPAKPVYIEALRAQGRPATAADLAASYSALPTEENAATHYLQVIREKRNLAKPWYALRQEREKSGNEQSDLLYGNKSVVVRESVDLEPDRPLWTPLWAVAKQYHEMVAGPTSRALAEVADAGYTISRYPIDLGSGNSAGLAHLAAMRDLARVQMYDVWIAAMEDRPADALQTLKAMGPLAESLREEPVLMSQLVRITLHGIMTSAVEQALNRTEFTDGQLAELQSYLLTVVPPISEHSMIARGLIGESIFSTNPPDMELVKDYGANQFVATLPRHLFAQDRIATLRAFAEMEKNQGYQITPLVYEIAESVSPNYVLPRIVLPGLDRSREAEFRCRVMHAIAATACAVERYRLANGALPATLDALVPTFIDAIPVDPFRDDQGPVSYRTREDGGYLLYTWARNRKDDGGIPRDRKKKEGNDWNNGDWIFSVAPLSFRNGPQLTDVPPVDEDEEAEAAISRAPATEGRRSLRRGSANSAER